VKIGAKISGSTTPTSYNSLVFNEPHDKSRVIAQVRIPVNVNGYSGQREHVFSLTHLLVLWSQDQKLEVYARAIRGLMELEPDRAGLLLV